MELLEGPNEVGLKGVASWSWKDPMRCIRRVWHTGPSTAVRLLAPVCHQYGTVYEGDFVKNWHPHILADR